MAPKLTELRRKMLAWIEAGHVSRGLHPQRMDTGNFPGSTQGAASGAAFWLVSNGYAKLPQSDHEPAVLTDQGTLALHPDATITVQPGLMGNGVLPYPFHVEQSGKVGRQDFWAGRVARVIGFSCSPEPGAIELLFSRFLDDPQRAVGMYVVTQDSERTWSTHGTPITSVKINVPEVVAAGG